MLKVNKSEYTLQNLITKKTRDVHASQLKTFRFDPTKNLPTDIARRDYMERVFYLIKAIKNDLRQ